MKTIYPWQQSQWKLLLNQYHQGKLPHALLLSGAQGLGKKDFAELFAGFILCENSDQQAEPKQAACGICRGCQLISSDSHPDFFKIFIEPDSKSIKIDQLRELIEQLNTTSQRSGYQVALIYPAEAMNLAAANALLKTLEEPPGQVLFILVSHQLGDLPATIISRCQRINFVGNEDLITTTWLQEQLASQPEKVNPTLLLRSADYAPLRALQLAASNYFELRALLLKHLQAISQGNTHATGLVFKYEAEESLLLIQAWISIAIDVARLQLGVLHTYIVNLDCLELLITLSEKLAVVPLQQFLIALIHARNLLKSASNANVQLVIETLLLQWQALRKG